MTTSASPKELAAELRFAAAKIFGRVANSISQEIYNTIMEAATYLDTLEPRPSPSPAVEAGGLHDCIRCGGIIEPLDPYVKSKDGRSHFRCAAANIERLPPASAHVLVPREATEIIEMAVYAALGCTEIYPDKWQSASKQIARFVLRGFEEHGVHFSAAPATPTGKGDWPSDDDITTFGVAADGIGAVKGSLLWDQIKKGLLAIRPANSPSRASVIEEAAKVDGYRKALQSIEALDEASGHELTLEAFRAVRIAWEALNPEEAIRARAHEARVEKLNENEPKPESFLTRWERVIKQIPLGRRAAAIRSLADKEGK